MSLNPCEHCDSYYDETPDTYCRHCGGDCCEDCLDGQWCPECVQAHQIEVWRNTRWQKLSNAEREDEIRKAI